MVATDGHRLAAWSADQTAVANPTALTATHLEKVVLRRSESEADEPTEELGERRFQGARLVSRDSLLAHTNPLSGS
jgi:hypothetical protein